MRLLHISDHPCVSARTPLPEKRPCEKRGNKRLTFFFLSFPFLYLDYLTACPGFFFFLCVYVSRFVEGAKNVGKRL